MRENKRRPLYKRLLELLLPHKMKLCGAFACMVGMGVCAALPAWLMKNVVDDVLISRNYTMLNLLSIALVVLFVFKSLFTYGQKYLMGWVGQKIVMDMRIAAYAHLQTL